MKKIKFPLKDEKISLQKNNKDKKMTSPLRYDHAALSLHCVTLGTHNKGYTVRGSARPSPKFFFHFVPEKLRISLTLCESQKIY
jgi:hypothetical protein